MTEALAHPAASPTRPVAVELLHSRPTLVLLAAMYVVAACAGPALAPSPLATALGLGLLAYVMVQLRLATRALRRGWDA